MDKRKDTGIIFYCFSPAVMLATFIIESVLALYVLARYRANAFTRIVVVILALLGIFQLAEYQICTSQNSLVWAMIGFVTITLLPILGLHLISIVSGNRKYLLTGYILTAVAVIYIILAPGAISGAVCQGNYVIFQTQSALVWPYALYYLGFLVITLWESLILMRRLPKKRNATLHWIVIGYLSFLLPWLTVYTVFQTTQEAIASVMCGFAVLFAFILAFKVIPAYHAERR